MTFADIIKIMENKLATCKESYDILVEQRNKCAKELERLDNLVAPLKNDVEGLELAIEGLQSTTLLDKPNSNVLIATTDILPEEALNSMQSYPAKKEKKNRRGYNMVKGQKRIPFILMKFDQNDKIIDTYPSLRDAIKGLKWSNTKIYKYLDMLEDEQLKMNGFYIAKSIMIKKRNCNNEVTGTYRSYHEACKQLGWKHSDLMATLEMSEREQLRRKGFYISIN